MRMTVVESRAGFVITKLTKKSAQQSGDQSVISDIRQLGAYFKINLLSELVPQG